jgi:small-conductance mechanosensitive channel
MTFLTNNIATLGAIGIVVAALLLGLVVRRTVVSRLARVAEGTSSPLDDAMVTSVRRPLPLWFALGGAYLAIPFIQMPEKLVSTSEKLVLAVLIASVTLWVANLGSRLLQMGVGAPGETAAPATGVLRYVVKFTLIGVGGLVLLSTLGISVTPVLTTVGLGGLAVALGLQETLANLFAGMQITLAGNIHLGDFIKLESGEEGYVDDIQWRATRVRTLPNNFVIIPNSRLAQSILVNYHRPSKDMAVLVQVGVHYASDLERVERITCDVARGIMNTVEGGVPDFEPFIRYHTFADSSINFTVILRAREFTDNFLIKHEFIKALSRAFSAEKIVIPYPIRAINLDQEQGMVSLSLPHD